MLDFGFYNMDCMEGMKQFPDKYFDLAVVDPPYGDGSGNGGVLEQVRGTVRQIQEFRAGGVARQIEVSPRYTSNGKTSDSRTGHGVMRTGGTWAEKFSKKSLRGMLPRKKNISQSFFASHGIK